MPYVLSPLKLQLSVLNKYILFMSTNCTWDERNEEKYSTIILDLLTIIYRL